MSYSDMPNWQAFVDEQINKRKEDITPPHKTDPQEVGTDGKAQEPLQAKGV